MGATNDIEALSLTRALYAELGSQEKVAAKLKISRRAVRERLAGSADLKPLYSGRTKTFAKVKRDLPKKGKVATYIVTSAQNNTPVFKEFFRNLEAYAAHLGGELMVSAFTYNHNAYSQLSVKPGTKKRQEDLWYDPLVTPYFMNQRVELAPGLLWCGETNILPTKEHPLTGYDTYTGRKSGIIPHAKVAMRSIASMKFEPAKFMFTTGTVTQLNYIQKDAGLKAEFHHTFGALIVEVDHEGDWWVRQLIADEDGTFQDLRNLVKNSKVYDEDVLAINWGDIHKAVLETDTEELCWGDGGILDTLQPRYQFMHDTLDFQARSHHDIKNPHEMFRKHVERTDNVEYEIADVATFLRDRAYRKWCETIVVDSNHDNAYVKWLRNADYRDDPINAVFFLESQLRQYQALAAGDDNFHLLEWAVKRALNGKMPVRLRFLRQDESFIISPETGGIECGMHGDLGTNGARGNPMTLSKVGRRSNIGHGHGAGIWHGLFMAGVTGALDQGYNIGPSNWSHSHIITYATGKRAIMTVWRNKPWAKRA